MAKQKRKSSLPRVIYHARFGDLPLAERKIVRTLPPFLVQDPALVARNRAFERALRKVGAIRKPKPAPAVKPEAEDARIDCAQAPGPVAEPKEGAERQGTEPIEDAAGQTLEDAPPVCDGLKRQAEDARTDCEAPGPVAEPNEGAERGGTAPVEDASNKTLEDAPREGHKSRQQRRKRRKFQQEPARQFLQELLTQGEVRENMRPWKICQRFQNLWPKTKREISDSTVRLAWKALLEEREVASKSPSEPVPVS
jgi:hypothetical protein